MVEIEAPEDYLCPLTLDVMTDPVMSKYGQSFERSEILQWLGSGHGVCPLSRRPLSLQDLVTNHALKLRISEWRKDHGEDDTVFAQRSPCHVYGFITLPSKDDATDRTVDEEDDLLYLQLAVMRLGHPLQQLGTTANQPVRIRGRQRRQSRGTATSAEQENQRQHRSIRRPMRGLRSLFTGH
jgi:U-box domain